MEYDRTCTPEPTTHMHGDGQNTSVSGGGALISYELILDQIGALTIASLVLGCLHILQDPTQGLNTSTPLTCSTASRL